MARSQLSPQDLQEIRDLAARWGQIVARRAFGEAGPGLDTDFETLEGLARTAAAGLTEGLLSAYEPESLLGYRNWEPGGTRVDQPGLLDGAPGVLLVLLAASSKVEPSWDRAFLLS